MLSTDCRKTSKTSIDKDNKNKPKNTFALRLFVFENIKSNPNISEVEIDKRSKITGNETSTVICVILKRMHFLMLIGTVR